MGIVCEIIANNTRKPIWGYKSLVYAVLTIGFLSSSFGPITCILTRHGDQSGDLLQTTTMIISNPIGNHFDVLLHLASGVVRFDFNTPIAVVQSGIPPNVRYRRLNGFCRWASITVICTCTITYYIIAHFHWTS